MQNIISLIEQIKISENIVLAGHTSPDGDAISANFSLALAIKKMGKNPIILLESFPDTYNFLTGHDFIFSGDISTLKPDLFIALDCGDISRLGRFSTVFNNSNVTANVDHHISNDLFAQINIVDKVSSSTSQIVFDIISQISAQLNKDILDLDISTCLYTGIVFDTCGFKHSSTSPKTHQIASVLLQKGVDSSFIHNAIIYSHSIENSKLLATAIKNLYFENGIVISTLSKNEIFNECGASYEDLEGISGYLLDIKGAEVAAFLFERANGQTKVSLRSKKLKVNCIAEKFGGGGHILACGATLSSDLATSKNIILNELNALIISN